MMTLLGSLIGFAASAFPELLKITREHAHRKHELALLDRQLDPQNAAPTSVALLPASLLSADAQPSVAHHASWVEALRGSVRPVITYGFFGLFALVKLTSLATLLQAGGMEVASALQAIWDGESQALLATVMSFWFGARSLQRAPMRHTAESTS
jgi:hypothetical protein